MRLLFIIGLCFTASLAMAAETKEKGYTVEGKFNWDYKKEKDKFHDIKAVFTKTDKADVYDVSFYFNWWKKDHVYTGQATGSLKDGMLKGTVKNDDKKRTFTFEGKCAKGVFKGTHKELKGKHTIDTGTITFSQASK